MSRYSESMARWEKEKEERNWKRRCWIATAEGNRDKIKALLEEGVENDYDPETILKLEKF